MKNIGYLDKGYQYCMDLDIWMRILAKGGRVAFIPKYLGAFRWYPGSKTYKAKSRHRGNPSEPPEISKIFGKTLEYSTERQRWLWRRIWKFYQVLNFNYIRSFFETRNVRGKYWKDIFCKD